LTVCLLTPTTARAASGADVSDLWWNPSESGWGMQLVQQATTVFATIFVYDTHGIPIWYTATLNFLGVDPSGALSFSGDLYLTNGPWFGTVPFNPAQVAGAQSRHVDLRCYIGSHGGPQLQR